MLGHVFPAPHPLVLHTRKARGLVVEGSGTRTCRVSGCAQRRGCAKVAEGKRGEQEKASLFFSGWRGACGGERKAYRRFALRAIAPLEPPAPPEALTGASCAAAEGATAVARHISAQREWPHRGPCQKVKAVALPLGHRQVQDQRWMGSGSSASSGRTHRV